MYHPNDEHRPRRYIQQQQWAKEAERTGQTVYGVKGTSILSNSMDLVKQCPIDYMHAVLEGVVKKLMQNFWFNSKHHSARFYLLREVHKIDRKLQRIRPPHDFRSTPRPIAKTLHFWKASEYHAFLLVYAIPVLKDFLPPDYIYHLALLVSAVHILLKTEISSQEVEEAERMLRKFYLLAPKLYPLQLCSAVTHSLIHIPQSVRLCGPLWGYSMFGYENMNGLLKKFCHGTRNVLDQLVFSYQVQKALPSIGKKLEELESPTVARYLRDQMKSEKPTPIAKETYLVGKLKHERVDHEVRMALGEAGANLRTDVLPVFGRIKKSGVVYHSYLHSKGQGLRNSSICMFADLSTDETCFGHIKLFCVVKNIQVTIVEQFEVTGGSPLDELRCPQLSELRNSNKVLKNIIYEVKKLSISSKIVAIPTSSILSKCVHIPVKYSPVDYIVVQPNLFEHS